MFHAKSHVAVCLGILLMLGACAADPPHGSGRARNPSSPRRELPANGGVAYVHLGNGGVPHDLHEGLRLMTQNGKRLRTLVAERGPADYGGMTWSPNGRKLVFVRTLDGKTHTIFVLRVPSGRLRAAFRCTSENCALNPSWSPNGRRLAFVSGGSIVVTGLHGEERRTVARCVGRVIPGTNHAEGCFFFTGGPSWSPDGRWLVFGRQGDNDGYSLFTVPATGGRARRIFHCAPASCGASYGEAAWSPRGQRIAFELRGNLYTLRSDGTELKELTHCRGKVHGTACKASDIEWSPDGRKLIIRKRSRLSVVTAKSGEVIALGPRRGFVPAWRPRPR